MTNTPGDVAEVGGPTLTLPQAVTTTGVPRATLQRRLRANQIPGAHVGPDGKWIIPVAGLIAAGMAPKTTPAPVDAPPPVDRHELDALKAENQRLRAELETARVVQQLHETNLADLRQALATVRELMPAEPVASPEPTRPRRWWRKG
jgi:hypothetical protein